jgi:protein involved in polysaccharide export with SLBB domain
VKLVRSLPSTVTRSPGLDCRWCKWRMRMKCLPTRTLLFSFLFASNALAYAQPVGAGSPGLRPGDRIRITVLGDATMSGEFEVGPDSTLRHPLYNRVKVAGIPVSTLKERIASFLRNFQREPQLEVEPLFKVTVGGEVRSPNILFLPPETTVADAVARAGGATDRGDANRATLLRDGRRLSLSLSGTQARQETQTIQSGDQISVAKKRNVLGGITPIIGIAASVVSIMVLLQR